jgi:hypothetical protein
MEAIMTGIQRGSVLCTLLAALVLGTLGCQKTSPDDGETKAIAQQFVQAVFDQHDADLAMSFVGPIQAYGYVLRSDIESSIADYVKQGCKTVVDTVQVGKPGDSVNLEITTVDTNRGITARTAWLVARKYQCSAQPGDADHMTLVYLEKVNGKWGVSKCIWYYGVTYHNVG